MVFEVKGVSYRDVDLNCLVKIQSEDVELETLIDYLVWRIDIVQFGTADLMDCRVGNGSGLRRWSLIDGCP